MFSSRLVLKYSSLQKYFSYTFVIAGEIGTLTGSFGSSGKYKIYIPGSLILNPINT